MANDLKGSMYVKDNRLIQAFYDLTINEHRVLLGVMSQLAKKEEIDPTKYYPVTFKDICDSTLSNSNNSKIQLLKAVKKLKKREVTFINDCNDVINTSWIQAIKYHKKNKMTIGVSILFSLEVIPYISNLTSNFTMIKYEDAALFNSAYALRFYELFMQWGSTGYREIEISHLRKMMMIEDKYPDVKNLRVRVIEPAIKQINEKTNLDVKFQNIKSGAKITHFCFRFTKKEKTKEAKRMNKKLEAEQKTSKNITYKEAGNGEHLTLAQDVSPIEILQEEKKHPELTKKEIIQKLLAERKAAS